VKRVLSSALVALGLVFAPAAPAQPGADAWQPVVMDRAVQRDIVSQHTGRTHRIFVAVPEGEAPEGGWPVLYLVDGNAHFHVADRLMRAVGQFARALPPGVETPVVVGIGYPDVMLLDIPARAEDLTPPAGDLSDTGDRMSPVQGGADRFLAFIQDELKPAIAAEFAIDPQRETLAGHSYGGLFALHTLFTDADAFDTYVAGSPSIWWNDRYILQEAGAFLAAPPPQDAPRLLIGVGGMEQTPMPWQTDAARNRRLAEARMVDNAAELAGRLAAEGSGHVAVDFRVFEGEIHYTASLPMTMRAVELAAGYPLAGAE